MTGFDPPMTGAMAEVKEAYAFGLSGDVSATGHWTVTCMAMAPRTVDSFPATLRTGKGAFRQQAERPCRT